MSTSPHITIVIEPRRPAAEDCVDDDSQSVQPSNVQESTVRYESFESGLCFQQKSEVGYVCSSRFVLCLLYFFRFGR